MARIIVVGAGINGVTSAIELKKRGHRVVLVDPGPLPHPLAASTDISKAVRAAYGPDETYTELAERSIPLGKSGTPVLESSPITKPAAWLFADGECSRGILNTRAAGF